MPSKDPQKRKAAQTKYRQREQLRSKGRRHASKQRAKTKSDPALDAISKAQANHHAAEYRAEHGALLARKQTMRRCRKSIEESGYDVWLTRWTKMHPNEAPPYNPPSTPDNVCYPRHSPPPVCEDIQQRLSGVKLERYLRIREAQRLSELAREEWDRGMRELEALDEAPDDEEGEQQEAGAGASVSADQYQHGVNEFLGTFQREWRNANETKNVPTPGTFVCYVSFLITPTMALIGNEAMEITMGLREPSKAICPMLWFRSDGYDPLKDNLYVVGVGRHTAVYTSPAEANKQTLHYPCSQQRVAKAWDGTKGAKAHWIDQCLKFHLPGHCPPPAKPDGFDGPTRIPVEIDPIPRGHDDNVVPSSPSSGVPSLISCPPSPDGPLSYSRPLPDAGPRVSDITQLANFPLEMSALTSRDAGPEYVYDVEDLEELSSDLASLSSPSSSQFSSLSSPSSSQFTELDSSPPPSLSQFIPVSTSSASVAQETQEAQREYWARRQNLALWAREQQAGNGAYCPIPSVIPPGYERLLPLIGDGDPSEEELSTLRASLVLARIQPPADAPILWAAVGVRGRLFVSRPAAVAAAHRRGNRGATIVSGQNYDALLDLTFEH
ncbi:hypothetical protein FB45DRAFT_1039935 [Roridomyces roridus]|uniref:Uncharacterized protein n=1 Tax=Roridomyces roridus TaxID=1738132 RepID=A0AAD7B2G9_9AGAR|nr:hypothetical protein FB45DRAFT_1039935 [Roridomyces roridus]